MPDCRYCDAVFDDEAAYHDHLRADHADDLGPIDRRRLRTAEGRGLPTGPIALFLVLAIAGGAVGFVILASGDPSGGDGGPYDVGAVHVHGTMEVVVDGERVDFSRAEYQYPAAGSDAFHFEGGNGAVWHVHARGVTLGYAMRSLGIEVTADSVTYEGTTYRDGDPDTSVSVTVNGRPVDPETYVLRGVEDASSAGAGDHVRIVVERT